ncbi:MAG: hypothetical protein HYW25_03950 [Candidatus Aenigmarchaeota archaeon]|nr:hypothetical protein [Candidatus Aenigmarchaeota archaeon]
MFDIFYRGDEELAVVVERAEQPKVGVICLNPVKYLDEDYPKGPLYCFASESMHVTGFGYVPGAGRAELLRNIRRHIEVGIEHHGYERVIEVNFSGRGWERDNARTYRAAMRKAERLVDSRPF